jgi:hypothetical protein
MKTLPLRRKLSALAAVFTVSANAFTVTPPDFKSPQSSSIAFTENKGQVHDQNTKARPDVLYGVMAGDLAVHIKKNGVSYQLARVDKWREVEGNLPHEKYTEIEQQTIYRIDLSWLNHNTDFAKAEDETLPGYSNYYLASCPDGALQVKSYKGVNLINLYNGIDLHYYDKKGELKHDYIVAPHADYKQIQVKVDGAEIVVNEDGSLLLKTPLGKIQEGAPVVYQNGKQLNAAWRVRNNTLSFDIDNYDPGSELVIDPMTRIWGTYYGSGPGGTSGSDNGYGCSTDASGNVYMSGSCGASSGNTILATSGAHQSMSGGGGGYDAFLVKFNPNGMRLWGTYYGGTGNDFSYFCKTDAAGNIYMCGATGTSNGGGGGPVIANTGAHQPNYAGGWDGFLVKFNSNGVRQWGTYYGGAGDDRCHSCAVDANGNVYLSGYTSSNGGIATPAGYDFVFSGGQLYNYDAFLVKFSANGVRQWGTYYGGIEDDWGLGCTTDSQGSVYMTGNTESDAGFVTAGAHQSQTPAGFSFSISYLVKFNSGGGRQWGTYYSGNGDGIGYSVATDASDNVYLAGYTEYSIPGTGLTIATPGSHQSIHGGGGYDAYLVKFNSGGVRQWGTYYGGSDYDFGLGCDTDHMGNVYLTGNTHSYGGTGIATSDSHQPLAGGNSEAYLAKFSSKGIRQWGTYYGALGNEVGSFCAPDGTGSVYMAGWSGTPTGTAVATQLSHQYIYGGGSLDAFLVKFDACDVPAQPAVIGGDTLVCAGAFATYAIEEVPGAIAYTWTKPAGWLGSGTAAVFNTIPDASGVISVMAENACGASEPQSLTVTVSECAGVEKIRVNGAGIKLYPNPNNGKFNLELEAECDVLVMNALGEVVYASRLASENHQISLENLAQGIYLVKLGNALDQYVIKVIKE